VVAQALFSYIERKVNILKEEKIIYKNIDDLIPYENNPRLNDQGVDALAESIKEFGFKVPIIIDSDGVIVAGHTRLKACKKLGIEEVPCIVADDLTDEQVKAFRLADNKVAELSDWDFEKLEEEIGELDVDMTKYGFVQIENLDQAIEDINDLMEKEIDDEAEPKAKRGDIYKLGEHYLMCGDSTEPKDVEKLTQGNKIDLVVTDPPYFIDYDKSALGEKIANDDLSKDERVGFLVKAFTNFKKALKDGGGVLYLARRHVQRIFRRGSKSCRVRK
jgi:site-specific DNA-methyltransferase (adenine-specific)